MKQGLDAVNDEGYDAGYRDGVHDAHAKPCMRCEYCSHDFGVDSVAPTVNGIRAAAEEIAQAIINNFAGCMIVPDGYTHELFYKKRMTEIITRHCTALERARNGK